MIQLEYPSSLSHLIKILLKSDEKKVLGLSNPDGYFYLYYIKSCIKFFSIVVLIGGTSMAYVNYSYNSNRSKTSKGFFELVSLTSTLNYQNIYTFSLIMTFVISTIAYCFLINFCNELSQFDFQPDQQLID